MYEQALCHAHYYFSIIKYCTLIFYRLRRYKSSSRLSPQCYYWSLTWTYLKSHSLYFSSQNSASNHKQHSIMHNTLASTVTAPHQAFDKCKNATFAPCQWHYRNAVSILNYAIYASITMNISSFQGPDRPLKSHRDTECIKFQLKGNKWTGFKVLKRLKSQGGQSQKHSAR